jgi:hypothetical protein
VNISLGDRAPLETGKEKVRRIKAIRTPAQSVGSGRKSSSGYCGERSSGENVDSDSFRF